MNKAFDSIQRATLIQDLDYIIDIDELHLVKILLDVKLTVKCGNHISDCFQTDTGDCASANEFTFYHAKSLTTPSTSYTPEANDHSYSKQTVNINIADHLHEHNY